MSGDYIRKAVAINKIMENIVHQDSHDVNLHNIGLRKAMSAIDSLPAADVVEVVRGKWEMNSNYPDRFICSECGAQFDCWHWEAKQMHYCPSCGAKMDGGMDNG